MVWKHLEKLPLGRPRRWEDNIKMELTETVCEDGRMSQY
jgi:hypothetical protein